MFQGTFKMWKEGSQVKATMTADTPKGPMSLDFSAPIPRRFAMSGDANVVRAAENGARQNVLKQVEFVSGFFKPEALVGPDCVGYAGRIYRSMRSSNPNARRAAMMRIQSLRRIAAPGGVLNRRPTYPVYPLYHPQQPASGMPEPMPVTATVPVSTSTAIVPAVTPTGSAAPGADRTSEPGGNEEEEYNEAPDQREQTRRRDAPDQREQAQERREQNEEREEEQAEQAEEQADVMGKALDTLYVINRAIEADKAAKEADGFRQNPVVTIGFDWRKSLAQTVKTSAQHPALKLGQKLFLALHSENEDEKEKAQDDLTSLQDLADEGNKNAKLALDSLCKLQQIDREKKREATMGGPIVLAGDCFWKGLLDSLDYLDERDEPGFWNNVHDEMEKLRDQRDQMGSFWGSIGKGLGAIGSAAKSVGSAAMSSGLLTPLVSMIPVVGPGVAAGMTLLQKARGADPGSVQKIQQVNQLAAAGVPDAVKAKENLVVAQTMMNKAESSAMRALKGPSKAPPARKVVAPKRMAYGSHYESGLDARAQTVAMLSEESVVG